MSSTPEREWAAGLMLITVASACAPNTVRYHPQRPGQDAVLSELSRRSTLSEAQLGTMLADCDANPQNHYVCAFRDFVTEDMALDRVVEEKRRSLPQCSVLIESKVSQLARSRDETCRRAAQLTYGDSALALTMQTACAADAISALLPHIQRITSCASRAARLR